MKRALFRDAPAVTARYKDVLDERGQGYLRQIVQNGQHMKRLMDDLLTYPRVTSERRPLLPTNVGAVFNAVLTRLRPELDALGATVSCSDLPMVLADAQQLDQLFQNLISNGLKYRREGVPPRLRVTSERESGMWRLMVSDNGIGIEPQYFERIFGMFQSLHGRDAFEGTGVGLAVCQKIVERHAGRLWVTSEPRMGSTFHFTLLDA
ncbi:sensor histidine kinase [Deinococcus yavapaiensis]|uniref:histidine kinase n=1 Tax=Deinococcus yavapaiensis KR-236 TaxID=694435 RepID=A0A318S2Z6_9DEIO|nr:ATP-binding protein [Deinococcus yavapaiensis]PYE52832.1 histidine kinase/DNA gyrase B/HSP90-like ATPase [Deinococcus yavapaiensis KR-236]